MTECLLYAKLGIIQCFLLRQQHYTIDTVILILCLGKQGMSKLGESPNVMQFVTRKSRLTSVFSLH